MAKPRIGPGIDPAIKDPPGAEQPKAPVKEPGKARPMVTKPHGAPNPGGVVKTDRKPERVPHDISGNLKPPKE